MSEVIIDGVRYVPAVTADAVSIHGMYDMHLFHRIEGRTVDEVIENWIKHNSEKHPANVGGTDIDDLGPSELCPATVLLNGKEVRRVGKMVFCDYKSGEVRDEAALEAYRKALSDDPDIPRLLAAGKHECAK